MATIACGGGPTLEQRRDFAGMKDGSQVPGYGGYIPQLKYNMGKTYGRETYDLSESYEHRNPVGGSIQAQPRPALRNILPDSTGDNKYTRDMVPGYTGYIPRWPFKFGNTYKEDSELCIDEHMTNLTSRRQKMADIQRSMASGPKTKSQLFDPEVRDHLNSYRKARMPDKLGNKRGPVEAPIPGYQGYIPRVNTTETGLGCRYNQTTKKSLDMFAGEQELMRQTASAPISVNRMPGALTKKGLSYNSRLYTNTGMIPKYTGFLPQRRYAFGNTYGDTTRSLDVCGHKEPSFGDYMTNKKTLQTSMC